MDSLALEFDLMFPCARPVGDLVFLELKGNPNHDSRGRFARTGGHGGGHGGAGDGGGAAPAPAARPRAVRDTGTVRRELEHATQHHAQHGTIDSGRAVSLAQEAHELRTHANTSDEHARLLQTDAARVTRTRTASTASRAALESARQAHEAAQAHTPDPNDHAAVMAHRDRRVDARVAVTAAEAQHRFHSQDYARSTRRLAATVAAARAANNNPARELAQVLAESPRAAATGTSAGHTAVAAAQRAHDAAQAALDHATEQHGTRQTDRTFTTWRAARDAHATTQRRLQAAIATHAPAATAPPPGPSPGLTAHLNAAADAADRAVTRSAANAAERDRAQQAADHQTHLLRTSDALRQARGGDPVHDRDAETAHHFVTNNPGSEHNAHIARAAQDVADAHRRINTDTSPSARARLDDAHAELRARLRAAGLAVPADSSTPIQGWQQPRGATAPTPTAVAHPPMINAVQAGMDHRDGQNAINAEYQRRSQAMRGQHDTARESNLAQQRLDADRDAALHEHNRVHVAAELVAAQATLRAHHTPTGAQRLRDAEAAHAFILANPTSNHAEHIARTAADVSAARVRWRANMDAGRGSDVSDMDTASARLRARLSDAGVRVPAAPAPPPPPTPARAAPPRQTRPPEPQYTTPHSLADLHAVAPGRVSCSWSEAEFKQHWGKHFPNSSPAEVLGFMSTGHRGFTIGSMHVGGGSDYVTYNINGKAPNGDDAFRLERTYKAGNKEVHHDYFRLEPKYQGGGTAKVYLAHQLQTAEANGYTHLTVFANISSGTGGYTWARMGFRADSPGSFVRVAQDALHKLSSEDRREVEGLLRQHARNPYITHAVATHVNPSKKAAFVAAANHEKALKASGTATAYQLSQAKADKERAELDYKVGKKLLLGTNWHGNVQLQDAQSRALYHDYLHGTAD